ncbi:MAG: heavy metal translocating P-type ATPase [Sphingobacteriales bacterium]|nr:heavy metal translocating P-type ATPase [Sphingobacteriales bacterium]
MTKKIYPVTGMSCAACAGSVESMVKSLEGVQSAVVNYANQQLQVEFDEKIIQPSAFKDAAIAIGYDLLINEDTAKEEQEEIHQTYLKTLTKNIQWATVLTVPLVVIAMFLENIPYANEIMLLLSTPVVFLFGRTFFINAIKQARHGKANMDSLVALSTGIAWLFSVFNTFFGDFWLSRGLMPHVYFEAAAVVILFIMLGKWLEENAKSNTSQAIKKLMGLQPKTVTLIRDGKELVQQIDQVKIGDEILVKSGEKIPVDGMVLRGSSYVDESMISGEPIAVAKAEGQQVFAGTINQKGSFVFKAQKVGSDTLLAQIIKMVQEAQGSKAPVQKLADKIAGIFVPTVLIIAVLTFLIWVIFGGANSVSQGVMAMVTVLVIACPCALGLATPTAIMVGVGKGAAQGILIKDAESLEQAKYVDAIILDKTGTITEGKPSVVAEKWFSENENLKSILKVLEKQSEHPLAEAVVQHLNVGKEFNVDLSDFESLTGKGAKANYKGESFYVGSHRLMADLGLQIAKAEIQSLNNNTHTLIYFASSKEILAVFAVADQIKINSKKAVSELQDLGIEVYMLTGDAEATAKSVAYEVGIQHYKYDVLPSDKADFVKQLQAAGKKVAMVGDGINDSQALAQADVSIAMGKGSDIAIDVAKITIISSDLEKIPQAIQLSKDTVKVIHQNLFWAFIYNIIGIPLAAGILYPFNGFLLNPMIAGAAMALSSVSVVSNSLRLKFIHQHQTQKVEKMENLKFNTNLKCSGCVAAIQPKMDQLANVTKWDVDLTQPVKVLTVEGENLNEQEIVDAIKSAGYTADKI